MPCLTNTAVQDVPDPEKAESWRFQVVCGWLGEADMSLDDKTRAADLKKRANKLAEPFRSAIQWIPEDVPVRYETLGYWVAEAWDTHEGRVTLAGDAAHPMPPHRGQGLNHAIMDVSKLVKALTESPSPGALKDVIPKYTEEVARRGAEETLLSRQNAFMVLDWDNMKASPLFKYALERKVELA